ncbi:MAG TPA: hypothetical protein VIL37_08880 [Natronosporangium sp.]
MTAPPLRRNRYFVLLHLGHLISVTGTQVASAAYPLLVLASSGSGRAAV